MLLNNIKTSFQIIRSKLYEGDLDDISANAGNYYVLKNKMVVRCGDGKFIELIEVRQENKKQLHIIDFINGFKGNKDGKFI